MSPMGLESDADFGVVAISDQGILVGISNGLEQHYETKKDPTEVGGDTRPRQAHPR